MFRWLDSTAVAYTVINNGKGVFWFTLCKDKYHLGPYRNRTLSHFALGIDSSQHEI